MGIEATMASRTHVLTETYLPNRGNGKSILTDTTTWSEGETLLEKEIAGHTAGMVSQGNSIGHSRYMSESHNAVVYRRGLVD
jgi:hypothetical protein